MELACRTRQNETFRSGTNEEILENREQTSVEKEKRIERKRERERKGKNECIAWINFSKESFHVSLPRNPSERRV